MPLTQKQIGTGLVVVGLAAGGYAVYDYFKNHGGLPGSKSTASNVSIALNPGATVAAPGHLAATIKFTNGGSAASEFAVQGAIVRVSDSTVQGHFFTSYAVDKEANQSNVAARVVTVHVPAGQARTVTLYSMPTLPGVYNAVFWIADNYSSGLIVTDTLYSDLSGLKVAQDATQASTPLTVS